jgi:hypothetical protein
MTRIEIRQQKRLDDKKLVGSTVKSRMEGSLRWNVR